MMGCLSGIARYILFLFNFLILAAAAGLIAVGVLYKVNNVGLDVLSVSTYTIVVGVVIALIAFFGCCGAIKESRCLLSTYAYVMVTIFILQVVLIVLAFLAMKNGNLELDEEVKTYLTKIYENIFTSPEEADIVNTLQRYFECCGIDNSYTLVTNATSGLLIESCFSDTDTQQKVMYIKNCVNELRDFIMNNAKIIGGIAIGVALVELVAAIFSFCVKDNISRQHEFV
ncbi:unnamed protein product [Phaedon cochleariae]|uniref:Tetraspanin n=1 Tax=Phaedon cochleariae TaxID=80249 RepID=A0A9N9SJG4_PHACE|nr:unnamed protein product [Phaedon cochleariae]